MIRRFFFKLVTKIFGKSFPQITFYIIKGSGLEKTRDICVSIMPIRFNKPFLIRAYVYNYVPEGIGRVRKSYDFRSLGISIEDWDKFLNSLETRPQDENFMVNFDFRRYDPCRVEPDFILKEVAGRIGNVECVTR